MTTSYCESSTVARHHRITVGPSSARLQAFRTRVLLTLSDESSCKLASEACAQLERLNEEYLISEPSQSGVGLPTSRAEGGKGVLKEAKSYSLRREPALQPPASAELRIAEAIVAAYDGRNPRLPTY